MKRTLLLSVFVIVSVSVVANAQVKGPVHREWEFGLFGATSSIPDQTSTTQVVGVPGQTSRQVGLQYSFAAELGARVTQNLGQHWAANLEYSFSNQPLTFTNLAANIPEFTAQQTIHRIAYEMIYYPLPRYDRLRPYVFAGPGVNLFFIHGGSKNEASALGMQLTDPWKATFVWGGGVKYLIQDHLVFNGHFTDALSGIPRYGLPRSGLFFSNQFHPGFDAHGVMNNWRFGVGLAYQWSTF